jgi:Tol biopolymer transport system component
MNKKWVVTIFVAALLAAAVSATGVARQAEDPGVMLRAAIEKEEVEGDLQGAIELYKGIVSRHSGQAAVAAKAQLRIGKCYEKLGNAEAVKAYEAVLSKFPKEADAVAEARNRLAELRKEKPAGLTMTRLYPPDAGQLEGPTLSPDGTKLAGVEISGDTGQNLALYDLTTGKTEMLTHYNWDKGSSSVWVPIWSPTGREIVHQANPFVDGAGYELHITDLAGRSRVLMKNPDGGVAPCDWLADGSAIVAVRANKDKAAALGLISVKDGSFRELSPLKRLFGTQGDMPSFWMSVSADASPDGRLIAFADGPENGGRDIYLISADGRARTTLIDHPADDSEPRWSPDGRHIVFLSDRSGSMALWGVAVREGKAEGAPFMILEGMQNSDLASWTKDGLLTSTTVIMLEDCVLDIDPRSHVALGAPRVMKFSSSTRNLAPRWSPDGRYLSVVAYSVLAGGGQETSLMVMPAEGGEAREFKIEYLYTPMGGTGQWLPEGSSPGYVVYDKDKRLFFGRLDLGTGQWKTRQIPAAEGFTGFMGMTWSADGKGFYYLPTAKEGAAPELVLHDMETGKQRTIFKAQPGEDFGWSIKASRDHKRLAMSDGGAIVIVDVETGKVRRIENEAKQKFFFPAWSPDGKYLVAKGNPGEGGGEPTDLFIISLADGTFKSLDLGRYLPRGAAIVTAPDWSPDGRKIAFDTRSFKFETNLIRNLIPEK